MLPGWWWSRCRCRCCGRASRRWTGWSGSIRQGYRRCSRSRRRAACTGRGSAELNRRFPAAVRVFAPSETAAARAQLGMRRFKTDDRDCAALTYLARQGHGRPVPADEQEALLAAVRWRRSLVAERKVSQQRLHDQVNALCPGLSAPAGHGRKLDLAGVTGQAFPDCLVDLAGRPASARSLQARIARGSSAGTKPITTPRRQVLWSLGHLCPEARDAQASRAAARMLQVCSRSCRNR